MITIDIKGIFESMGRASAGKAFTIDAKTHLIYRCRWNRIGCRRPPPIALKTITLK